MRLFDWHIILYAVFTIFYCSSVRAETIDPKFLEVAFDQVKNLDSSLHRHYFLKLRKYHLQLTSGARLERQEDRARAAEILLAELRKDRADLARRLELVSSHRLQTQLKTQVDRYVDQVIHAVEKERFLTAAALILPFVNQ